MTGGLRSRVWARFIQGPDRSLLEELYVPGLSEAHRYDRCCAYFSSSVLAAAALGFSRIIERLAAMGADAPAPAIRLLVNEELDKNDVEALIERGDAGPLESLLSKRFRAPVDVLERGRLAMLAWLVKAGLLEVRVGVMRSGAGILHAKFGIFRDGAGDAVIFAGSGNESASAIHGNYEQYEVSESWNDEVRYRHFQDEFETLWADRHATAHVVPLPEALRQKLIRFAPKEVPRVEPGDDLARQRAAMIWQFLTEAPYLEDGASTCDATSMVTLWPHQGRVIEEAAAAWPDGRLLCDEVGMGKTIEAILVLRRLLAGRGVKRALLLLPAGLLKQWQGELREKGGLDLPRLEGTTGLVWADGREEKVSGLGEALHRDLLLMSRETARTETNAAILLAAEPWDLLLLDEAHAARRRKQEEGDFNSGTLLLDLLRQLQLRRKVRGFLFLSATPMQTHPWEPWDLLSVLGEGGAWLSEFGTVRDHYEAIQKVGRGLCERDLASRVGDVIAADSTFPGLAPPDGPLATAQEVATRLQFSPPSRRAALAAWMRAGSPLTRRMHRNTRGTLRKYYAQGLLEDPPPKRDVNDVVFDYSDQAERNVYNSVQTYVERRFRELEEEKSGKGFVMTIYRRRASSSPESLKRSLLRRAEGLGRVAGRLAFDSELTTEDQLDSRDLDDVGAERVSAAFPSDPQQAAKELREVGSLLGRLEGLGSKDSKRDKFFDVLRALTDDGRPALVFSEYADTVDYLASWLMDKYGFALGCYTGDGGRIWDGAPWKNVPKDAITAMLRGGRIKVLLCTDAASEGLNLQAAGAVINYDLPWNPSKVEQRIGRIDRIGQKLPRVKIANLLLRDSVDEKVYRVLHERCELFEHFVGPMQPVLSRARKMLLGQEHFNPTALRQEADAVDGDPIAKETYFESDAEAPLAVKPAVARADLLSALTNLPPSTGFKFKLAVDGTGTLTGGGLTRARIAATTATLELDSSAQPLSPLAEPMKNLTARLQKAGECLPLIVGVAERGAFRSARALWSGNGGDEEISTMLELAARLAAWDGQGVAPARHAALKAAASKRALVFVEEAAARAVRTEMAAQARQVAAARRRLLLEVGRYLACVDEGLDDPNAVLSRAMDRSTQDAVWLREAWGRFNGYPEWTSGILRDLRLFARDLMPYQRQNRITGTQLRAALDDPRWAAANAAS